jgi:SAM-dependent methyltransferase
VHINNTSYDGFESSFSNKQESAYRSSKLHDVQKNISLIKNNYDKKITVLDIGSGNSKFLYALNNSSMLDYGYGIEISKSRHLFAEKWRKDLGINNVTNIHSDIFCLDWSLLPKCDLIYCPDMVFQFFEPINRGNGNLFLSKAYNKLKNGGKLIMELDTCDIILDSMSDNKIKLWREFDKSDPWRYMLWDCNYENNCMSIKKTFIKRDLSKCSNSHVILYPYSRAKAISMLGKMHYSNVHIQEYWNTDNDTEHDEFIIIGEKNDKT